MQRNEQIRPVHRPFPPACFAVAILSVILVAGCGKRSPDESPAANASGPATTPAAPASPPPTANAIEAALRAADDYVNTGDFTKAEMILARLVERAPQASRGHEAFGHLLVLRAASQTAIGDADGARATRREAFACYGRAIDLDPESAGLQHSAGVVAMLANEPDAALARFERAAVLDPLNPQYPLYAAQVLAQRGEHGRARAHLDRVLALDPDEPLAHASLAMIAIAEDRYGNALDAIAEARRIEPTDVRFRVQEAVIHRRAGQPERALELLVPLAGEDAADPAVTLELAMSYDAVGRHEDAGAVWARRFTLTPVVHRSPVDAVRAGEAYLQAGDLVAARQWLQQARLIAPGHAEVARLEAALDVP